jgi:putative endonuclease
MAESHETGSRGEQLAAEYLMQKGWKILARNFRRYRAEIDLIAADGECLVFVEVKAARTDGFGPPELRVDRRKRQQMCKAALAFLQEKKLENQECRFDVIAVEFRGPEARIRHLRDAFRPVPEDLPGG